MTIERVERFATKGQVFDTAEKAINYREGLVEEFFRRLPGFDGLIAKERIQFIQGILDGRDRLRDLLDFSSKTPPQ